MIDFIIDRVPIFFISMNNIKKFVEGPLSVRGPWNCPNLSPLYGTPVKSTEYPSRKTNSAEMVIKMYYYIEMKNKLLHSYVPKYAVTQLLCDTDSLPVDVTEATTTCSSGLMSRLGSVNLKYGRRFL